MLLKTQKLHQNQLTNKCVKKHLQNNIKTDNIYVFDKFIIFMNLLLSIIYKNRNFWKYIGRNNVYINLKFYFRNPLTLCFKFI